jgi:FMNH2-dependent dimethyl sulfone monooxygenase
MRFGIMLHTTAEYANWDNLSAIASEAERLGYDSLYVNDHFYLDRSIHGPYPECWTVLSAIAASTNRVRLGTYVLCNQFRHPSLLAKMTATLDAISRGRLNLGIGSGWFRGEHLAFGFEWGSHATRIARLRESLELMKKLWTEDHVTYNGKYYHVKDASLEPKPIQKPHPPILIGGSSKEIKELIAKEADGWIPVLPSQEQLTQGIHDIGQAMTLLGRDTKRLHVAFGASALPNYYGIIVAETDEQVKKMAGQLAQRIGKPLEMDEGATASIMGTPGRCITRIEQLRETGVQEVVSAFQDFPSLDGMRLFARTIFPHFK